MPRTAGRILILLVGALASLAAAGCYQHVVGAKGPGAERYDIHEPSIGRDESVWAKPNPRAKRDDTYGLGAGSDVPGQVRKPPSSDN